MRGIRIGELVTAACALVAGLALADGIESANVVGYYDNERGDDGYNWSCIPFTAIGEDTYSITDITLDDDGNYLIADNCLQVLDPDAYTAEGYFYTEVGTGVFEWLDEDGATADRVFNKGEGFLIENLCDILVKYAGEVPTEDFVFEDGHDGYNWLGNPFPAAISITDITLDDDGNYLIADNCLQVLDPDAYTAEGYFYTEVGTGVFEWLDEDGASADREFDVGEGFLIENLDCITVTIAKPYDI